MELVGRLRKKLNQNVAAVVWQKCGGGFGLRYGRDILQRRQID